MLIFRFQTVFKSAKIFFDTETELFKNTLAVAKKEKKKNRESILVV
jgi:hypothetical protein